jgi:hypothetical protein
MPRRTISHEISAACQSKGCTFEIENESVMHSPTGERHMVRIRSRIIRHTEKTGHHVRVISTTMWERYTTAAAAPAYTERTQRQMPRIRNDLRQTVNLFKP